MIGVVAKMVRVHPQTLRLYERLGLLTPQRSGGKVRLYSHRDVEKLRVIQKLTRELGVNLAGVEMILSMRRELDQLQREMKETLDIFQKKAFEEPDARHSTSTRSDSRRIRIKIERG